MTMNSAKWLMFYQLVWAKLLIYWDFNDANKRKYWQMCGGKCLLGTSNSHDRLLTSNNLCVCSQTHRPPCHLQGDFIEAALDEFAGYLYTETSWKRLRWARSKMVVSIRDHGDIGRIRTGKHARASTELRKKSLALLLLHHTPTSICVVWCRRSGSVSNNGRAPRAPRAPAVNRELPHSATPSTAVVWWQGRDDIYQAGLATCCDIYPRLRLTRAAPPRPSIGAAARGAK